MKEDLNLDVSLATMSEAYKKINLLRISARKFLINHRDRETRINVARQRLLWTHEYNKRIVYTDESGT